uniref:ABC transporter domain-containing protein n=1 Tax=viral metagenome TaxID=1070528 RepID=A0A6C0AWX9_9ZZZZ
MTSFCETTKNFNCFIDNNEFDNLLTELTKTTMINEPELLEVLPLLLEKIGDYKFSEKATRCGEVIISKMNPFAMKAYMNILYEGLTSLKWQIKKASLILLGSLAKHQKEIVKYNLPNMILKLITMASDVKKDVKEQTKICFEELCSVIDNVDIIKIIPSVIKGYMEPVKYTEASLDCLVATSFINDVDMPTLGLLVPVLTRGMREKKVANQRRAALVIGNMCKLVNDPRTAYEFYPILKPVLEKGIDEIAIEEVRKVCENSLNTLQRVSSEATTISDNVISIDELKTLIKEKTISHLDKLMNNNLLNLITLCCHGLVLSNNRKFEDWNSCMHDYFLHLWDTNDNMNQIIKEIYEKGIENLTPDRVDPEDEEEDLCNAQFSLAYGTRVLLHQTPFRVKIGRKYGLVGPNGAGKSTLMKSIAGGNLEGFPTDLITIYVECEIIGEKADMTVLEYIMTDEKVIKHGCKEEKVRDMLTSMGFGVSRTAAAIDGGVSTLSGGWRMKLALSRAMLLEPDMLLLDEPTNHLDQFAVKWLTEYIQNLQKCTCLVVSHDTTFLDNVCTNIIHYENLKLKSYKGNLSDFVKQKPEAKAYYELSSDTTSFSFPEPGPLDGVKSLTKAVLKTKGIHFQYPVAPLPQLIDVSIQCSLASRVAVVGVNGAGKSTLVKLMVGELEPDQGTIEKHPNLRVAYVAQHAFAHIEDHLEKTPVEYVMWRYRGGIDKEMTQKDSVTMTDEEIKAIRKKAKEEQTGIVEEIKGRRTGKREHEYEVIWEGIGREDSWHSRTELLQMGYKKMLDEKDEQIAMESMLGQRKLTTGEIQKHFDGFGLEPEFAQHTRMNALSGGQKVKVVLGAGLWNLPHIVILDEPTNFLDRDSLGALATAIKEFKGGIFMISHNAEFYEALCPEKWILESGRLTVMGAEWMEEVEKARKKAEKLAKKTLNFDKANAEAKVDASGNIIEEKKGDNIKDMNDKEKKKEIKNLQKQIKDGRKKGSLSAEQIMDLEDRLELLKEN